MNIFSVNQDPYLSAQQLPDKHVVKMALETSQLLSVIYSPWYFSWGTIPKKDGTPYKTERGAFRNHPSTKWASSDMNNLAWLIAHGLGLCNEYYFRYNKHHSCKIAIEEALNIFTKNINTPIENLYSQVQTFTRAMPDNFKLDNNISDVEAYQRYVASKPWAQHNYLRVPDRKPLWMINYAR
jgi:hypothetical protein